VVAEVGDEVESSAEGFDVAGNDLRLDAVQSPWQHDLADARPASQRLTHR